MSIENKILEVLRTNKLAVISTSAEDQPESALVAFAETEQLELYFQTSVKTRKYFNIQKNERVAFVIGFGWVNLQYEGKAELVTNGKELEAAKQYFLDKESPTTQAYLELPETAIFKVSPTWIGYRNYEMHPPEVHEINF